MYRRLEEQAKSAKATLGTSEGTIVGPAAELKLPIGPKVGAADFRALLLSCESLDVGSPTKEANKAVPQLKLLRAKSCSNEFTHPVRFRVISCHPFVYRAASLTL